MVAVAAFRDKLRGEGVEFSRLETFQTHLDASLCHLLWVTLAGELD